MNNILIGCIAVVVVLLVAGVIKLTYFNKDGFNMETPKTITLNDEKFILKSKSTGLYLGGYERDLLVSRENAAVVTLQSLQDFRFVGGYLDIIGIKGQFKFYQIKGCSPEGIILDDDADIIFFGGTGARQVYQKYNNTMTVQQLFENGAGVILEKV